MIDVLAGRRRWAVECCDVLDGLRALPAESVNCVVTSPPYWGLRDYGVAGQIGIEPTHLEFVARLVGVFSEVRRVLRPDGTCWVNLGDGYAGSWGAQSREGYTDTSSRLQGGSQLRARQIAAHPKMTGTGSAKRTPGVKAKSLLGLPWRVALALVDDGWLLRNEVIWSKPNAYPENVADRLSRMHEHLFFFTRSGRYTYDADAIREPYAATTKNGYRQHPLGRNRRSVWSIATESLDRAAGESEHFAVFPSDLVEPCILAGCPVGGVVLDPFSGSGTTGVVALRHNRRYVGLELNPAYVEMSRRRIKGDCPMFNTEAAG